MFNKISGYIDFSGIGVYYEDYISELMKNGIYLQNVNVNGNILYASIKRRYYLFAARCARKFGIRTRVIKRKGIYFFLNRYRKRSGMLLGALFSILMLLILESFVWKIDIHGNNLVSDKQILSVLKDNNITLGSLKSSFDVNDAETRIKHIFPLVSWVNIDLDGSTVNIHINESDEIEKGRISLKTPCNVIAKRNGRIVETEVYSGSMLYPIGSGVSKGNVIVSGAIDDGAGHMILSHANAKIIAEFTEEVSLAMPYTTNEKHKTGLIETEKELMLFGFVIPLSSKISSPDNKICREDTSVFEIGSIRLPWKIRTYTYTEYEEIPVTRKAADCERLLERQLEDYCANFYSDYEILDIEKTVNITENEVVLNASVLLKGDIAELKEIYTKN